jgi:hypothetical protein
VVRRGLAAAIVAVLAIVCMTAHADAQTVRGRLMKGAYPIAGIGVRVTSPTHGTSGVAYSGPDGMYYLVNIPPGTYTLQVLDIPRAPLLFQIIVHQQQWVDIAPIQVR